ncbi:L-glutamate gamma-semialdehyde dehydrogenase [Desulfospira joergensenii]|uniref:L-glutamate gamma-semialdehyde dehydrogenase n=1 Tax=Desulfospira joergensenii TaxID=53329 RepID=UPI0003B34001|nr:L-glutamate gamma-semialdehyde dehydrogenase [Desulfospira joergensenii]
MNNSILRLPEAYNEPIKMFGPGSPERPALEAELQRQMNEEIKIPLVINGRAVHTGDIGTAVCPHDHNHVLARFSKAGDAEILQAIEAALKAKPAWEAMPWQERAAIFLKAADLISQKYTHLLNGATMLGQSKNAFQAEIDATCELVDFLRFNVKFMEEIYQGQPRSEKGIWNRTEYRPLEGFVFALTPFNFTAIAGNLCTAPAMMGNTVVWKPASTAVLSGFYIMEILKEAGLPDGVINFIPGQGSRTGKIILSHEDLAGIHFTGSTGVFQTLWRKTGENIDKYRSYPRIVGETGGKDYIFIHPSGEPDPAVTAAIRGAFEYQGQKCSACSRLYLPRSMSGEFLKKLENQVKTIKTGSVQEFGNFVNAVIDEKAFDSIDGYISRAESSDQAEVILGGKRDKSKGYFIEPTVILAKDPHYESMENEIFGPVLTLYIYEDQDLDQTLDILDRTSIYALTGAIFARDRAAVNHMMERLTHTAGNFYINDKPTGAVVGQQPFGGARKSGTNDKAGSLLNLIRWTSPRTIKESFVPPMDYQYPFMAE